MPSTSTDRIRGLSTSVAIKAPVQAVSTTNITLSGAQTINGKAVTDGHRVLVTAQTNAIENGIWDVASTGSWRRSADFDGSRDVVGGTIVVGPNDGGTGNWLDDATAETVGEALYPATDAEVAAGVDGDITAFRWPPGDIRRYGGLDAAADNSAAFDAAVAQAAQADGADVYVPPGTWALTSTVVIATKNNVRIYGDGYNKSAVVVSADSMAAFSFTGVCARCSVRGIWIGSFSARTGTTGISIVGTSNSLPCAEFTVEDVKIQNVNNPMVLTWCHQSYFSRIRIVNSLTAGVTGVCINGTALVSVRFRDIQTISSVGLFGNDTFRLNDDCDTVILDGCEIGKATGVGIVLRNPTGATGPRLIRLLNCYVESCTSAGFSVEDDCRDVRFQGCHSAVNGGVGFAVAAGESIQFVDCFALQNDLHGFIASGGTGIKFLGCEASNNSQAADNSYDGIYIDTDYVRVIGCKSGDYVYSLANDQRYGLTIAIGADYIIEADNDLSGNQTGELGYSSTEANNQINTKFKGSKTYDPGSLADGGGETTTVTVLGADLGDFAEASFSLDISGLQLTAYVSASDTVTVRFQNETGAGPVDIGSGTLRARVRKA